MIEVRVWADIHSTGLYNSIGEFFIREETTISDETWQELQAWVEAYDDIAIMEIEERKSNLDIIKELDKQGISLMYKIAEEWNAELKTGKAIKFVYYSEGLLSELRHHTSKSDCEEE